MNLKFFQRTRFSFLLLSIQSAAIDGNGMRMLDQTNVCRFHPLIWLAVSVSTKFRQQSVGKCIFVFVSAWFVRHALPLQKDEFTCFLSLAFCLLISNDTCFVKIITVEYLIRSKCGWGKLAILTLKFINIVSSFVQINAKWTHTFRSI